MSTTTETNIQYPTTAEMLSIIATTKFDQFCEADWEAWSGCDSKNPLIGYHEELSICIDGDVINVVHADDEYGGVLYHLILTCW
jgi:hypothetical protein